MLHIFTLEMANDPTHTVKRNSRLLKAKNILQWPSEKWVFLKPKEHTFHRLQFHWLLLQSNQAVSHTIELAFALLTSTAASCVTNDEFLFLPIFPLTRNRRGNCEISWFLVWCHSWVRYKLHKFISLNCMTDVWVSTTERCLRIFPICRDEGGRCWSKSE